MRALRPIITFALLTLLAVSSNASPKKSDPPPGFSPNLHQWGAVTLFHGLPSDHVRAIAQTPDGTIWFGTDGGLAHYDGRRVQKLQRTGLPSGRVRALAVDADGALWVGADGGAARFQNGRLKPVAEAEGKSITAIDVSERGRAILASVQGFILDCAVHDDGLFTVRAIEPNAYPLLVIDSKGAAPLTLTSVAAVGETILVGTIGRGLLSIEQGGVKELLSRPRPFFVEAIAVDTRGRLWLGAQTSGRDTGLFLSADLMHPAKVGAGLGTVTCIRPASDGSVWVGADGHGVSQFKDSTRLEHFTFENTAGGLRSNRIYSILMDREGVLWFGTDRGVCRYDRGSPRVETVSADHESNFVRTLFHDSSGRLWCGTNRGLFVRRYESSAWQPVPDLANRTIHSIGQDATGRMLIGAASGLFIEASSSERGRHPGAAARKQFAKVEVASESIRAICQFKGQFFLATFGQGLDRLDGSRPALVWPPGTANPRERQVTGLYPGISGLWIGTAEAGAFLFDGKTVARPPVLEKLSDLTVWAILESDSLTWLGTDRGLFALRDNELITAIESADVRVLVASNSPPGAVWCATSTSGLYKVSFDDAAGVIVSRFDSEQGLPSSNVFSLAQANIATGGELLWIGTNHGLARYEPGGAVPSLQATRALGSRPYQPDEIENGLDLEYPQNSLVIDVAASSSRTFAEQFQYWFALEDGGGRVIASGLGRESQFTVDKLEPGRYRVAARAFTKDLVSSDPLSFEFTVAGAPFPWTSAALSVLLLLALGGLGWGYVQNRMLARSNVALGEVNRELSSTRMQLADETEAERRRIARDLHDQTLADLRRLALLTDQLSSNGSGTAEGVRSLREEIESISTEIRRICEDLSPSLLSNVSLAAALEWALADAVAHLPPEQRFECEFNCDANLDERLKLEPAVQIQIYRVAQEVLSNICRHSEAARVRMNVSAGAGGEFELTIEDDGEGFDPSSNRARAGRGLANIRSRASLIEAGVEWSRTTGGENVFKLRRPASRGTNPV